MTGKRPWTDFERLMLIRSMKEMLPEMAEAMKRPLGEVVAKHEQLQKIFEKEYEDKAQKYLELGFELDEAFLKVADEVHIDLKRIRELEERM